MTEQERQMAFDYLLRRIEAGGTEESINGLFIADSDRAAEPVQHLLKIGLVNEEAQIAAAWNLYKIKPKACLLSVLIKFMSSQDCRLREKAVYYLPGNIRKT